MKRRMAVIGLCVGLAVVLGLLIGSVNKAQGKSPARIEGPPKNKVRAKISKADLAGAGASALREKEESAFWGECIKCWKKVGAMSLPTMSAKLINKGGLNAPPCKGKLTWQSAKPPYGKASLTVDIPGIAGGETKFVTIRVPQGKYFQIAKPVTFEVDYSNKVEESNDSNNTLSFTFSD